VAPVIICKRKRPKGIGRWGAYELGTDGHGTWLFTPKGSVFRAELDGRTTTCAVGRPEPPGLDVVHLVPATGWWFAVWTDDGERRRLAIDICRPCRRDGDEWSFVDLELDLLQDGDGPLTLVDEDEFDAAVAAGIISAAEQSHAWTAVTELEARVHDGEPPFDGGAWDALAAATAASLPPLTA
jgi:hypothetical protein